MRHCFEVWEDQVGSCRSKHCSGWGDGHEGTGISQNKYMAGQLCQRGGYLGSEEGQARNSHVPWE